jgi:hypothetical protein
LFPLSVSMTPAVPVEKFTSGVVYTGGASGLGNIFEFFKNIEMTHMLFSGAWGKLIMKKPEEKIS